MTEKATQIKNSFIYLAPVVVAGLLPLLSLPIFTRILTTEDYGALALAQVYATLVSGLANLGLNLVYERSFFQYKEKKEAASLFYSILLFAISTLFAFAALTYFLKEPISRWLIGSDAHAGLLFWAFCAIGLVSLRIYFMTYIRNSENAVGFARYTISESILWFLISLFLVAYLRTGVIGLVWAQLFSNAVLLMMLGARFMWRLPFSLNFSLLKSSLKIGYPLTPRLFLGVVSTHLDKYMISLLATIGGVGIYNIAQKIASMVFTFMTAPENVFTPRIYKKMFEAKEEGSDTVGAYVTPFAYVAVFPALLIALFSEEGIRLVTAKSFHGAAPIVTILCMYYAILFFGKLTGPRFLFAKKTHIVSLLSFVTVAINVALSIPFIYRWGVTGAAWAMLLAGLISSSMNLVVAQRYYAIHWEYRKLGGIFLVFFSSSLLILFAGHASWSYATRVVLKLSCVFAYLVLGVRLRYLTPENIALVKNLWPRKVIPLQNGLSA